MIPKIASCLATLLLLGGCAGGYNNNDQPRILREVVVVNQPQPQQQVVVAGQNQQRYGTYQYCGNGQWHFGNCGGAVISSQQFASLPAGGGFNRCEGIGSLVGGTIGSLNRAHPTQAVILGAVAGGVAGHLICSNPQGRQIQIPMTQSQQVVIQQTRPPCWEPNDDKKRAGTLNWPGHPKDGKPVCAYPEDKRVIFF